MVEILIDEEIQIHTLDVVGVALMGFRKAVVIHINMPESPLLVWEAVG